MELLLHPKKYNIGPLTILFHYILTELRRITYLLESNTCYTHITFILHE